MIFFELKKERIGRALYYTVTINNITCYAMDFKGLSYTIAAFLEINNIDLFNKKGIKNV